MGGGPGDGSASEITSGVESLASAARHTTESVGGFRT